MSIHEIAHTELMLCWAAWVLAFAGARKEPHKAAVTARAANWGILLQFISYFAASASRNRTNIPALDVAAMILGPIGVALVWASLRHLGKQWRVQAGLFGDHELVRTGPYRFVRHPLYFSMLLMYLASALIRANLLLGSIGLVLFLAGTEIRVRVEDSLLASRFGAEFQEFKDRVPAYLPFLR